MASTRRTPEETLPSLMILIRPISPVACVCVPPQSSVENSPIFTTRTRSPYFSPNSAIALYSLMATSIGTFSIVSTGVLRRTCLFIRSSMSCNSSSATAAKWEKSKRRWPGSTSDPACFTCAAQRFPQSRMQQMRGGVVAHGGFAHIIVDHGINFHADRNRLAGLDFVRAHALHRHVTAIYFRHDAGCVSS